MTNLFKNSGPYEISISQYGSTLADLPLKFASRFATFGPAEWIMTAVVSLAFWTVLDKFFSVTPRKIVKKVPLIGKYA
jgi:hypothetical protein